MSRLQLRRSSTSTSQDWDGRRRIARDPALDRARGLAVVLMLLDHVLEATHAGTPIRLTLTRASMPLFFLVSGHLVKRLSWRTLATLMIGANLPLLVPWIDDPNVLVTYAIGSAIVVAARRWRPIAYLVPIWALTWYANGYGWEPGSYAPLACYALMCIGHLMLRGQWSWALCLPAWLAWCGRWPLSVYVGHLLLLQLVVFGRLG